jgi:hypothetical protein
VEISSSRGKKMAEKDQVERVVASWLKRNVPSGNPRGIALHFVSRLRFSFT